MVQASSLGPNKHKRGRLRYLRGAIVGESAVDFEPVFEVEKTFKKMTALFE